MLCPSAVFIRAGRGLLRCWPLLLPILLLLPGIAAFPYPSPQASYSDVAISHYPNALYLRQSLLDSHRLPLWSPSILSGYPFAANPLAGIYYPPGWLVLLLPLPLGFNLLVALHLLWAGIGMYALLRLEGLSHFPALLGGLAFEALPKLFAHYGAGHLTLLYAVCWTPWLLLVSRPQIRAVHRIGQVLPALVLALIFLADVRWTALAGALWWAYVLWRCPPQEGGASKSLRRLLGWTFLAALLAAPLALPLAEYTAHSTRSSLSPKDVLEYSLPPARLLGLVFPEPGGPHEWTLYPGALVLVLGLLALVWHSSRRRAAFWAGVACFGLLFALGDHLPVLPLAARLPLIDLLRVPARALFLSGMAVAALAGIGLQALISGLDPRELRQSRLLLAGWVSFVLLLFTLFVVITRSVPPGITWGSLAALFTALWIWIGLSRRMPHRTWIVGLLAVCLVDLLLLDATLFAPRPASAVLASGADAAAYLSTQPGNFRIYSPSYSFPQQTAAANDLRLADGVDPLQMQSYVDFMERASGVPVSGYSVTVPPFENGDPQTANEGYIPDARLLGLLNVAYVLAEYDLDAPGLVLAQRFGETRLYTNEFFRTYAWIEPEAALGNSQIRTASLVDWTPNRIKLAAIGPGNLVLSEIAYPGWKVWVDGELVPIQTRYSVLRSVPLASGSHRVTFAYQPWTLFIGLAASLLGWIVILPVVLGESR